MYLKTGVADKELVSNALPTEERRASGPYAIIECFQEIPCNPCTEICPFGSILPMDDINDLPRMDYDTCTGCGLCAAICPGLAIFIINESYSDTVASVGIPYEFVPLPQKGDVVKMMDRAGEFVTDGKVLRVVPNKKYENTPVVTVEVPKDKVNEVRFLQLKQEAEVAMPTADPNDEENLPDTTIICRCENITVGEVRKMIDQGYDDFDELKRLIRTGMGPCQGRTCRHLIMQEISRKTGKKFEDIELGAFRPPTKPIQLEQLIGGKEDV
ncbi:MAG: 4Fe-4S binding protein [Clostridiaceae bacterium]|jgi:Fe-S-cluster-containing hydrogenase component 2/bacterioferritin-associated ferredoxin|nr:4Fe-4S binding protein [Clostridiaceae bacterium]